MGSEIRDRRPKFWDQTWGEGGHELKGGSKGQDQDLVGVGSRIEGVLIGIKGVNQGLKGWGQ